MLLNPCEGDYPVSLENFSRYVSYKDVPLFKGQQFKMDNPIDGMKVFWEHYPELKDLFHLTLLENGSVKLEEGIGPKEEEVFIEEGIEYAIIDGVKEKLTPIEVIEAFKVKADDLNDRARERRALKTLLTQYRDSSLGDGIKDIIGKLTEDNLTDRKNIPQVIYFIEKELSVTREYYAEFVCLNSPVTTFGVKLRNKTTNRLRAYIEFLERCVSGLEIIMKEEN